MASHTARRFVPVGLDEVLPSLPGVVSGLAKVGIVESVEELGDGAYRVRFRFVRLGRERRVVTTLRMRVGVGSVVLEPVKGVKPALTISVRVRGGNAGTHVFVEVRAKSGFMGPFGKGEVRELAEELADRVVELVVNTLPGREDVRVIA